MKLKGIVFPSVGDTFNTFYKEYLPFEFEETKIVVQYLYPSYYKGDRTVTEVLKIDNILICFAGRNEL